MIAGGIGGILVLIGIYVYLGPLWLAIAVAIPIAIWLFEEMFGSNPGTKH